MKLSYSLIFRLLMALAIFPMVLQAQDGKQQPPPKTGAPTPPPKKDASGKFDNNNGNLKGKITPADAEKARALGNNKPLPPPPGGPKDPMNNANNQKGSAMDDMRLYRFAIDLKDYPTAISALANFVSRFPNMVQYKDTLATLYYKSGNYVSCATLCKKIDIDKKDNPVVLDLWARALVRARSSDAPEIISRLMTKMQKAENSYYKVCGAYAAGQYDQAYSNANALLNDKQMEGATFEALTSTSLEKVPARAAINHLLGKIESARGKKTEAFNFFQTAAKMIPTNADFANDVENCKR